MTRSLYSGYVYPGHPIILAKMIMEKYPSLLTATHRVGDGSTIAVLADHDIPGAGGCVWAAVDTLRYLLSKEITSEQAFIYADRYWDRSVSDVSKRKDGQHSADAVKNEVIKMASVWPKE